jgi:hypothetical protein
VIQEVKRDPSNQAKFFGKFDLESDLTLPYLGVPIRSTLTLMKTEVVSDNREGKVAELRGVMNVSLHH